MKVLSNEGLKNKAEWIEAGYNIPEYDREIMIEKTVEAPEWIHFGAGNIFKAFLANNAEKLLNEGRLEKGIIAVEGFDPMIAKASNDHDNLTVLATLKHDGTVDKTVIGSVAQTLLLDPGSEDFKELEKIFENPSLKMASFTITEKGYALTDANGNVLPIVQEDFEAGPANAKSFLGKVAALLYERYQKGQLPVAMVSMDNVSHNGEKLETAILGYANAWKDKGLVEEEFVDYLSNPEKVSFPWSMIDKITPRPDASVEKLLNKDGIEGLEPVKTSRGSFVAPFVNAEETEYLIVEDQFPNGRPDIEQGGIAFTDRDTVNKVETMKVTTCLNPLHTALAVFGVLLDYNLISEEMKDEDLVGLIKQIGYEEGLPVVVDPGILNPKEFIDTVIEVRLPNPFMPDAPQRIATDTSQKLAIRYGETIKKYIQDEERSIEDLQLIPLVFAGWMRYLMGIDDNGETFELSDDPLLPEVVPVVEKIKLGDQVSIEDLKPILENEKIFGLNLIEAGLADQVINYFNSLISKPGAVRETLHQAVQEAKK